MIVDLIGGMVMKKFSKLFCVIIMAILLVVPSASVFAAKTTKKTTTTTTTSATYAVSEDEKAVTMHVFYSPTCGHCAALHEFLGELKEDKDYKALGKYIFKCIKT